MNFVEKHSKLLAVALCLCASGPVLSTVRAYEVQPGWHSNGEVSYYIHDNHQRAKGLTEIDNATYYFDQSGEMQYGWQNVSNQTYYFDNNGKAVTGKTEIQGTTYNFQQTGSLNQGWNADGSYYNEKGFKVASGWVNDEGSKYYFDENGNMVKGQWMDIDGSRYYFNADGKVATGEVDVDGTTYYTDDQGILNTGWADINGSYVYYNDNGSKNTDSYKEIDGSLYAFDENGSLLTNTEKDGYVIDNNGVATVKPEEVVTPAEPETPAVPETPAEPETPVVPDTPVVDDTPAVEETPVVPSTPAPDPTPVTPEPEPEPAPAPVVPETPAVPEVSNDKAAAIAAAAKAQVGVNQDCTMLVTNSLAAVGIYFHGWPEEYAALGSWTSNPVPGDIIIYSGHVAIYIGNGRAIHGGFYGYTTVEWTVECTNALIGYIHVA